MPTHSTLLSAQMRPSGWQRWQQAWSAWWPSSAGAWVSLVLVVFALGLLWTFYQVTRAIVQQSELRLQRISLYNQATWRCNGLREPMAREHCLSQRKVLTADVAALLP